MPDLATVDESQLQVAEFLRLIWIRVRDAMKLRWSENPKEHALDQLAESISKHGYKDPPHYDKNIGIDDGNGRIETLDWMEKQGRALPRGLAKSPAGEWAMQIVIGVDAASESLAKSYALDVNNLVLAGGDFSPWDISKLWDKDPYLGILKDLAQSNSLPVSVDGDSLDALLNVGEQTLNFGVDTSLGDGFADGKQFGGRSLEVVIRIDPKAATEQFKQDVAKFCTEHGNLRFRIRMSA